MADRISIIKEEITNDPLARGYAPMTDAQVATDMNLINRPVEQEKAPILTYCLLEKFRTNTGTDIGPGHFLYGRIQLLGSANAGDNPTGSTGFALTAKRLASVKGMLRILGSDSEFSLDLNDVRFEEILDDLINVGAIGNPDKTALMALSTDQQSRGNELGVGRVREGDVIEARRV